jgi:hypothetical protein
VTRPSLRFMTRDGHGAERLLFQVMTLVGVIAYNNEFAQKQVGILLQARRGAILRVLGCIANGKPGSKN